MKRTMLIEVSDDVTRYPFQWRRGLVVSIEGELFRIEEFPTTSSVVVSPVSMPVRGLVKWRNRMFRS